MIYLSFFQISKTYKYGSYNFDLGAKCKLQNWVMFRWLQSHTHTKKITGKLPPTPPPPPRQLLLFQPAYNSRDNVYQLLRKVFALPFLPADDIPEAFQEVRRKVDDEAEALVSFMDYVNDMWINSDIWSVECWSVFGRSILTNNDVEGWHNRLNRRAKKGNLPFYLLLSLLYIEACDIPTQVKLVKEGKLWRHQAKNSKRVQGMLVKLWEKCNENEMSTSSLLRKCGRLYGPC